MRQRSRRSCALTLLGLLELTAACEQSPLEVVIRCGNGRLDVGETCDDGNQRAGDGCSAKCTLERPGSGAFDASAARPEVDAGETDSGESQLDGGDSNETCNPNVEPCDGGLRPTCGPGEIEPDCTRCEGASLEVCIALDAELGSGQGPAQFDGSLAEVYAAFGVPSGAATQWEALPQQPEYAPADVRYFWLLLSDPRATRLPSLDGTGFGVGYNFVDRRLFRISYRYLLSGGTASIRAFAVARNIPWTAIGDGGYFRVRTERLLMFGATRAAFGCVDDSPCIELIQADGPTWRGQLLR